MCAHSLDARPRKRAYGPYGACLRPRESVWRVPLSSTTTQAHGAGPGQESEDGCGAQPGQRAGQRPGRSRPRPSSESRRANCGHDSLGTGKIDPWTRIGAKVKKIVKGRGYRCYPSLSSIATRTPARSRDGRLRRSQASFDNHGVAGVDHEMTGLWRAGPGIMMASGSSSSGSPSRPLGGCEKGFGGLAEPRTPA